MTQHPPRSKDKLLFTPGPLTTSPTVKKAMLRDLGSRDGEFIDLVKGIRRDLLALAGVSQEQGYEAVIMQGSGTFGVEAVLSSATPPDGKWLVLANGAYGRRMAKILDVHRIVHTLVEDPEDQPHDPGRVADALANDPAVTSVAVVHCETTSGLMNPVEDIGRVVQDHGKQYFIDSMSAFGAVEFDMQKSCADFIASSANKCIEGVPGFAFCLCRRESLVACKGQARTLSLDLYDQWETLERTGQFRFTPPTHVVLAFRQALDELQAEGGVAGRAKRYRANNEALRTGMRELGFVEYLAPEHQGHIITSFRYPNDERFDFESFYSGLNERGFVIYPGKLSNADCFRIGNIGRIFSEDIARLLNDIRLVLQESGFDMNWARRV